ncbi:MAG: glycosyltransferase [Pseudomonadota bacterium]
MEINNDFSVLMSLYKNELASNLDDCLYSIQNQILRPSEIVIIYDGPISEEVDLVVNKYAKENNIKKVYLKENVGLGKALRFGIENCKYDLVARMDTDDICNPDRFSKQLNYMKLNPDVDILGSSVIEFDSHDKREKRLPLKSEDILSYSLLKNPINHMTVLFRKHKIIKIGSYQHHFYMEDYNLWLRAISRGLVIENMPDNLVYARVNNNMLKRRRGFNYIKSEFELMKLKLSLNLYPNYKVLLSFLIRVSVRLLPLCILSRIYKFDRK